MQTSSNMEQFKSCLDQLLVIYSARERRAQQELYRRIQSCESAQLAHQCVLHDLRALEQFIEQVFSYLLDGGARIAGDAQAAITVIQATEVKAQSMLSKEKTARDTLNQAILALDEARVYYTIQVRSSYKMRETRMRQIDAAKRVLEDRAEDLMSDEFVPFWIANRK